MGNTAVAVLHYDLSGEIAKASPRMAQAMREMPGSAAPLDFGFGRIVAWDHASGYQVCVIHGNTGWRLGYESNAPQNVVEAAAHALRMMGWTVTPPKE